MKRFVFGALVGLTTWVALAVISATIYNVSGNIDMLQAHPYMWTGSIALASFVIDSFVLTKLAN